MELAGATWKDIEPLYAALAARPLSSGAIEAWLADWSRLEAMLSEAAGLAMIAYTRDTTDPTLEAAHLRFSGEIGPRSEEQEVVLAQRLIDSGFARPDLEVTIRKFRTRIAIFRQANVPIMKEVEELDAKYQKLTGGLTVKWDGIEKTIPELQPFLQSPERRVRERAFRQGAQAYIDHRTELAALFDQLFLLRRRIAANAGFANFEDYSFQSKFRFDYTPADCRRFHEAVEEVVMPAIGRMLERRRLRLGLTRLRPWDLGQDPEGRDALRPFQSAEELVNGAARVFGRVSPDCGSEFRVMIEEDLLDLETRKGKAPGGYCATLSHRGRPFIFMNAVGVAEDVSTLMHEGGHAFHAFAAHRQPLVWQRQPGLEMCELASMSMELLSAPFLGREQGGFFSEEDHTRARVEHLEDVLLTLAHIASVDAFQSWLYTSGMGADFDARDRAWLRIRNRFETGLDWSGLESERIARWYRQLHIFIHPFYYIEYGIAQLGALQVWRNSLRDGPGAVQRYRDALALGATLTLPELYRAAGAELRFDATLMRELIELVERELEALR